MKYKKHIATGVLAVSLLIGGSSVFAATPQDLGIKNSSSSYVQKNSKTKKNIKVIKTNSVVGTISILNDTGFAVDVKNIKTNSVSSVDVITDTTTTYTKNGKKAISSDLATGQKVIVYGTLDKTTNIMTAKRVKIVIPTIKINKKIITPKVTN